MNESPTLGDKNYVFYDLSISRPLSKHFDFYADYNLAWRKYNDTDRNTDELKYWSKNIRHFMLASKSILKISTVDFHHESSLNLFGIP